MAFPRVLLSKFFPGKHAFGADSPFVSSVTLVLNVHLQKNSIPGHSDTK